MAENEEAPKAEAPTEQPAAAPAAETAAAEGDTPAAKEAEANKENVEAKEEAPESQPPQSAEGAPQPAEEAAQPAEGAPQPAEGVPNSENESAPAAEGAPAPVGESAEAKKATTTEEKPPEDDDASEHVDERHMMEKTLNIFGEPRAPLGPAITLSSSTDEEEEEEESEIRSYLSEIGIRPEKQEPINREHYIEEYNKLKLQKVHLRRKNGYLLRKMSEYFRKRKMDRVFDDAHEDQYEELLNRYERKTDEFSDFREKALREKQAIEMELRDVRNLRDEQKIQLETDFAALLSREKEVATGLIDSNTGKSISDKVVERLINRQQTKSNEASAIRLVYLKRRDKVREIEHKLKALETIGGTLHLIDFEQLRMDNQTFSDKIEERDEELMRLRDRYSHAVHVLAHNREKSNTVEEQICDLKDKNITIEDAVSECRERLNKLKIERDNNRAQAEKLKLQSGLLTYSRLLLDMETSLAEEERLTEKLNTLTIVNKERRQKLMAIRRAIENIEHAAGKTEEVRKTVSKTRQYYRNRPTLVYPVLPRISKLASVSHGKNSTQAEK